jgi:smad nuclear-interacting protein 1
MYVFKGEELLETVELAGRSCWLVGRERVVADFPIDHPSCSKQHAAIQFRHVTKTNEYGDKDSRVRPYIIDLESANGTLVNKDRIPSSRYLELRDKDLIQFGFSTREYVLMLPEA